jgi:hypothetical protein
MPTTVRSPWDSGNVQRQGDGKSPGARSSPSNALNPRYRSDETSAWPQPPMAVELERLAGGTGATTIPPANKLPG